MPRKPVETLPKATKDLGIRIRWLWLQIPAPPPTGSAALSTLTFLQVATSTVEITQFLSCRLVWRWRQHFTGSSLTPISEAPPHYLTITILLPALQLCVWGSLENQLECLASLCGPCFKGLPSLPNTAASLFLKGLHNSLDMGCYLKVSPPPWHPHELSSPWPQTTYSLILFPTPK